MNGISFLNAIAARLTDATPRQIITWTERGIIIPLKDSSGTGISREYNYENLLEISLCKRLSEAGLTLHKIGVILRELRNSRFISKWATNFHNWNENAQQIEIQKKYFKELLSEAEEKDTTPLLYSRNHLKKIIKRLDKMKTIRIKKEPNGILFLNFSSDYFNYFVLPYEIFDEISRDELKEAFTSYYAMLLINLGAIKASLDSKIKE